MVEDEVCPNCGSSYIRSHEEGPGKKVLSWRCDKCGFIWSSRNGK